MPKEKKKYNEADMFGFLQKKYPEPAYALFPQVRNSNGFTYAQVRTVDALAMSLWPSRGLTLSGFEIKVSRADWLNELKKPEKADEIASYCDEWWLVVSDKSIVEDGELPSAWGLYAKHGRGLRCIKQAEKLDPKPLDRTFLAAILRKAFDEMPFTTQQREIHSEAYKKGYDECSQHYRYEKVRLHDCALYVRLF